MPSGREVERLAEQLGRALEAFARLSAVVEATSSDIEGQCELIDKVSAELDKLRNGDEERPGILTKYALLEAKVNLLWAIVGVLVVGLITSGFFWRAMIAAAIRNAGE